MNFNTKIEKHNFRGLNFLIKRDDLIHPEINGNKAYKFNFLLNKNISHIVSYGGNQSNAMLAMSVIAKIKNIRFSYFTYPLPSYLKNNFSGNIKLALDNGMDIHYCNDPHIKAINYANINQSILIPQGGAMEEVKYGIEILKNNILNLALDKLCVFYASGSGSSALFLSAMLKKYNIDVVTTHCVGNKDYLIKQFLLLETNTKLHPIIISPTTKITFAKPNIEVFNMYAKWLENSVEFDLLYDSVMWVAIQDNIEMFYKYNNLLFIHSGGLQGNQTQLERYLYKYPSIKPL